MITDLLILVLSVAIPTSGWNCGPRRRKARDPMGVSAFVIGVTVVGFGTAAPELAASVASAISGHGEIAVGNVVGSNIMNIAMVLGVTAMVSPIPVDRTVIRREVIVTIAVAFVPFLAFARGGVVERPLGVAMVLGLVGFLYWTFRASRREGGMPIEAEVPDAVPKASGLRIAIDLALVVVGIAMLVFSADLLVGSATSLPGRSASPNSSSGSRSWRAGPAAPELATSLGRPPRRTWASATSSAVRLQHPRDPRRHRDRPAGHDPARGVPVRHPVMIACSRAFRSSSPAIASVGAKASSRPWASSPTRRCSSSAGRILRIGRRRRRSGASQVSFEAESIQPPPSTTSSS